MALAQKISRANALIIDASLVHDYTHLGFNKKMNFTEFSDRTHIGDNYQRVWLNKIQKTLLEHKIKVLIVRDKVDSQIFEFCNLNSILILNNLPNEIFKKTLAIFKCNSLMYFEDFNEDNVLECEMSVLNSTCLNNYYIKIHNCDQKAPKNETISVNYSKLNLL